ncbi:hypothetical protein N0Y54_43220 [Nostoc punctiforme UO1]|uniref:hypothetical protein n=1 Tax=Nostoc punctiforme TaxID=272131 RepID=UPI0030A4A1A6
MTSEIQKSPSTTDDSSSSQTNPNQDPVSRTREGLPTKKEQNKNNFILDFLDYNGMRPIIALVVIGGAIWITLNSNKICIIQEPIQTSSTSASSQPQVIIRDNPVCSKYFEIAALVLGGLLGLAQPSTKSTTENSGNKLDN